MMKIAAAAIITVIAIIIFKQSRPEYVFPAAICCICLITLSLSEQLFSIFGYVDRLSQTAGLSTESFELLLRAVGIGYITQLSSDICSDAGENALASNVEMAGKITLTALSLPYIASMLSMIEEAISNV